MLKKNAEALRETTLAVTREAERSCIAPETLKETNEILLDTLSEMLKIREEGQKARREAEGELRRLEQEIRRKLISSRA